MHRHTLLHRIAWRPLLAVCLMLAILSGVFDGIIGGIPDARATTEFSIKTGYYLGNGTPKSITGLGFRPELLIIKADTAAGSMIWKSSAMPASTVSYLGTATADNGESQIIFDNDGFTVSIAPEVNTINVRYTFIAFAGSDCTAGGTFCIGAYAGDGNATQKISTGFTPDFVWVKRNTAVVASFRTSPMLENEAGFFAAIVNNVTGANFTTMDDDGFTVGLTNNTIGGLFYFVAFKSIPGKLAVGQFTGNGIDDRNITGLGFQPDVVLVKQNSANAAVYTITESWGDYSHLATATINSVNHIQALLPNGFQVGNSANANASGVISHYVGFGGAPDPAPAGSFTMQRGSYEGTGFAQTIDISFAPDLVFIKGDTNQAGVWTTSNVNNLTQYFAAATAGFANGITSLQESGFSIGTHATVNANGITYQWVAFGNATTPAKGAGAADFLIGSYTGNGIAGRKISNLGFAPDMVTVVRATAATAPVWRAASPVMADNTSAYFGATADITDGTAIQTLDADGFTVGAGATNNTAGSLYIFFAFKSGASTFRIGSYDGTGTAQAITNVGFHPEYVWTKRSTAILTSALPS
jgi:predicted Zn-dependent protease with MMP-like domain